MFLSVLWIEIILLTFGSNGADVGSKCKTNSKEPGTCVLVFNCSLALAQLTAGKSHNLKRCGFEGITEIVCCPKLLERDQIVEVTVDPDIDDNILENDHQSRFTKRRSEQACEELNAGIKPGVNFNILGGEDAELGEFPHMAALGYMNDNDDTVHWRCGASLISSKFLLTAAHCIANSDRIAPKVARLGVVDLRNSGKTMPHDYNIDEVTVHPKYSSQTKHNDIGILRLRKHVKNSPNIYPACLYKENDDPLGLIVTGWGTTSSTDPTKRSVKLQKTKLTAVDVRECNQSYTELSFGSKTITFTQICAWDNSSDACDGDSGGPLQIQNKEGSYSIVGIVSYGSGCGGKVPAVYTRVSRYLNWIENIVWNY